MLSKFPAIVGPTASGKSALAGALAHACAQSGLGSAEIISADSMQVYQGLDIGTAKPSPKERKTIPHHLIDIAAPTEPFSVDHWLKLANNAITNIAGRGSTPIIVGGTHLYIQALLFGLFEGPPPDLMLRAALEQRSTSDLRCELEQIDPEAASRIHPNDSRRTIRALEVHAATGTPISKLQAQWEGTSPRADILLIGLEWDTALLNRRINARVKNMMDLGLLEEVRKLLENDQLGPQAREALGYKQLASHLQGELSIEEAVERIKVETRRFAKNQRTWIRRLQHVPQSMWIDGAKLCQADHMQTVVNQVLMEIQAPKNEC